MENRIGGLKRPHDTEKKFSLALQSKRDGRSGRKEKASVSLP